jgi:hypothetical protein
MSYMLYEVWVEDEIGHQELIDTTASQKEAFELAKKSLEEGWPASVVYQENDDGDSIVIKRFQNTPT